MAIEQAPQVAAGWSGGRELAGKLLHELARRQARYGLATLCIGGGMGIAAVFERL